MAEKPFKAYSGNEPFIFVSYSHSDNELVFPEIEQFRLLGYHIWYDEGIQAGKDWTDQLAQRLADCAMIIYLITPNAVLSRHCANEIYYALELEKPMLAVHLKPATLPPGQRMQLGAIQAIIKYELSAEDYADKLSAALRDLMAGSLGAAGAVPKLPMGIVTLLRLDIVDAHQLATRLGDDFHALLTQLREMVRSLTAKHGGHEVEMHGDICMVAFTDAPRAVQAAVDIQKGCAASAWPQRCGMRVRIGLHTGQPSLVHGQYFGVDVQRAVQIAGIANGAQVLLSAEVRERTSEDTLPAGASFRELGTHRLKGMPYPEVLYDLEIDGLPSSFAPVSSLTNRPSNLPKALPSFVGRQRELAEICELLRDDAVRILTLTGPGGTGKSRLSIEAARRMEDEFPDGVFLVKLATISDPTMIIPTIAETLGIKELAGQSPLQSLTHRLAQSRVLLVMDNFEQIVQGAEYLLELMDSAALLKVVVSSREALHLRAEQEYQLEPLQLPHRDPTRRKGPLEDIEAVKLFIERVREFRRDFKITAENANAIASICLKLDGLPLALELAAARMTILTPQALLQNLERSLDVLKGKSRDLPDRQKTLRSTVAWSYDLLDAEERALFRQLSIFRGGFSLSAAEMVLSNEDSTIDLVDAIESLVSKSLFKLDPDQLEPRFWILETIREYGQYQLRENAETEQFKHRHATYFLHLAESLAPGLISREQRVCVTRMLADADNIRSAMDWYLEQGDVLCLSRAFKALWWLWIPRGNFTEGREWVERALEKFAALAPCRDKALIYETAAWLDALAGDYAAAAPNLELCHEMYQQHGDESDVARVRLSLGLTHAVLQIPGGAELGQQALATFEAGTDRYYYGLSLVSTGIICLVAEDVAGAADAWQRALDILDETGNTYWPAQMLINLSHFHVQAGDWEGASRLILDAQQLARDYDYPMIANLAMLAMSGVLVVRRRFPEAARMFGALGNALEYLGVVLEPLEQVYHDMYMGQVREHMNEAAYTQEFQRGAAWGESEIQDALRSAAN